MSGSTPTNNSAVQFEMSQAQQAQQQEADRQARLQKGQDLIDQIFNGSPVMGTRQQNFDWSQFNANNVGGSSAWKIDPSTGAVSFNDPTQQSYGLPSGYKVIRTAARGSGGGAGAGASMYGGGAGGGAGGGGGIGGPTPANPLGSNAFVANPNSGGRGTGAQGGAQNPFMPIDTTSQFIANPHSGERGQQNPSIANPNYYDPKTGTFPNYNSGDTGVYSGPGTTFGAKTTTTGGSNVNPQLNYQGPPGGVAGGSAGSGGQVYAIQGPDGKIYYQGDPLSYSASYDTGQKSGGFDDAFYNKYKQKVLDYYNPQEQRQYDINERNLRYNLANQGNLISSTAADQQGEQAYNDALAKAAIVANANSQTGQLKNQIQSNKESLISQLYATEDPTLTANLAESSAKASQLQDPTLTPGAAFLTPALSAAGSAAQGYLYPNPYGYGQQQPQQGTVAPASGTGSGRLSGS